MNLSASDFITSLPIWSLALFSCIPLLAKALSYNKEVKPVWLCIHAGLGFCFSIISLIFVRFDSQDLFSNLLRLDHISWLSSFVILALALFTLPLLMAKKDHVVSSKFFSEYIFLFMNSVIGLLLILWSNNMISAFIAIEHISLCFYLMIPLAHDRVSSIESGIKYFILGSIGACIFLLGIAFVYISAGTLDFNHLISQSQILVQSSYVFLLGIAFICIALLFKISIFPFQFWLPDVYQGSATPLTAFMSTSVKASVFILLLKILFFIGSNEEYNGWVFLQWLSVLTLLIGHISALLQENLKNLLIYSSIAHAGYMIMAVLHFDLFSVSSLLYYIIIYGVVNFGALAFVMFFEKKSITGISTDQLKGLYSSHPIYALCMAWFLFNLAGLPPTAGFFAKLFIFESLVQKNSWWMLLWAIIGSAVALYYYLKPVIVMYTESDKKPFFENIQWIKTVVLFLFVMSIVLIGGAGWIYGWIGEF